MRDYYDVLEVDRAASMEEIRRSYRKKARALHPDYAGVESEEAFKELSVAYETLSDPDKRKMYDLRGPAGMDGGFGDVFGFSDLFEAVFSGGSFATGARGAGRGRTGSDTRVTIEVSLKDVVFGTSREVVLNTVIPCSVCSGTSCAAGTSPVTCSTCGGSGSVTRLQQSLLGELRMSSPCSTCGGRGATIPSPCSACSGSGRARATRTVSVTVPPGVEHGSRIRFPGEGEAGARGGAPGDLYVEVLVKSDSLFTRRGYDLHTTVSVPMTAAALGVAFPLSTFDGDQEVVVLPGTQPGAQVMLNRLGIVRPNGSRGNLYVHIEVTIPTKLDDESRELLEAFAEARGEQVCERPRGKSGVFERLKDALVG